jgi:hypothetical protein
MMLCRACSVEVNLLNSDELDRVVEAFGGHAKCPKLGRPKAQCDRQNLSHTPCDVSPASKP